VLSSSQTLTPDQTLLMTLDLAKNGRSGNEKARRGTGLFQVFQQSSKLRQ
jgi:hypothetical protein